METQLLQALRTIDDCAVGQEPSAEPTLAFFPPGSDRYGDDAQVLREVFEEGHTRGQWEFAEIARKALATIHTPDVPPTFQRLEFLEAGTHEMAHNIGKPLTICNAETHDDLAEIFSEEDAAVRTKRDEAVAYAHLFVAAPELLAALKLARAYLDHSLGSPTWDGKNPYPVIDAAIARAEGRALAKAEA